MVIPPSSRRHARQASASDATETSNPIDATSLPPDFSRSFRPLSCLSALPLALCMATLVSRVNTQELVTFPPLPNIFQCVPVNITWSGGISPYMLDIVPYTPENPVLDPTQRQRYNVSQAFYVWTPNITAGIHVEFNLYDNSFHSPQSQSMYIEVGSSDRSCLLSSVSSSFSSSSSPTSALTTSVSSPGSRSSPTVRTGLSTGAIVGIALAVASGAPITALVLWCILRRRPRRVQPEFVVDEFVGPASHIPSIVVEDGGLLTSTGWSGFSSTLASPPPLKYKYRSGMSPEPTDGHIVSGASSPEPMSESDLGLHPLPYSVQRTSTASLPATFHTSEPPSVNTTRKWKNSARDVLSADMTTLVSSSDLRASTARPTQQVSEADTSTISRDAAENGPSGPRQEVDGGVRLAGGPNGVDVPNVVSDSGMMPPPPYSLH